MVWFEYKYVTSTDIIKNIKLLTEYSIYEYALLIGAIVLLVITIYYLIPIFNIYIKYNEKESSIVNRKKMIKQIVMQKDINDEIEKVSGLYKVDIVFFNQIDDLFKDIILKTGRTIYESRPSK